MAREIDVKALISHLITGDGLDRCRICMGDTSEGQVFLDDTILIEDNIPVNLGSLLKSVTGVEVETSELLPKGLCRDCTNGVCMAALFKQQIHTNSDKINNILKLLSSLKQEKSNIKTLYATITDNNSIEIYLGNNATKTIKDACVKLKKLMTQMKTKKRRSEMIEEADDKDDDTNKECSINIKEEDKINRKCPNCGKSFLNMYLFGLHLKHGNKRLCWKCHEIIDLKLFQNHLEHHHENLPHFKCIKCYDAFSSQSKLEAHLKLYHRGPEHLSCYICKYSYTTDKVLSSHLSKHEGEKCSKCRRNFYNRRCAYHHAKTCKATSNEDLASFICDYCAREFNRKCLLRRHITEIHLRIFPTNIQCEQCHKRFRVRAHLVEHCNTHIMKQDRKTAYTCDICHSNFFSKRGYDEHYKKHVNPEVFSCDICHSKFVTRGGHRKHYKKHFNTLTEINIINIEGAELLPDDIEFA